jgi:hypothetical protein
MKQDSKFVQVINSKASPAPQVLDRNALKLVTGGAQAFNPRASRGKGSGGAVAA